MDAGGGQTSALTARAQIGRVATDIRLIDRKGKSK
jgi:hypothetical protein